MSARDDERPATEEAAAIAGDPPEVQKLKDAIVAKLGEYMRAVPKPSPPPVRCLSSPEEIAAGHFRFAAQVSPEVVARLVFSRYAGDAGLGIRPMTHEQVTAWLEADVPTFRRFLDEIELGEPVELSPGTTLPAGARMWVLKPDRIYLTLNIGP